ncbi:MAG: gamma-glutamylcyclotransferase [Candidatus Poseidoniaceae archaeon]|nr:gamma-glutamylcyclotransferase [Candidatus Poseidoniaceae archaeon]
MTQNRRYFGYGSNLDWDDWVAFCRKHNANPDGLMERAPAWLVEHHLKFHYYSSGRKGGAADVVPINTYHATPGVLFDVDEEAWTTLVRKEGAPNYYEEKEVLVIGSDGRLQKATTFVVCKHRQKADFVQPTDEYRQLIHDGLEHRGLPTFGLDQALQHSFDQPTINHLFVYGTLMSGQGRFNQLEPYVRSSTKGWTKGQLHHLGSFPGLKLDEGVVHGELIEMRDVEQCLERTDGIEGFRGFDHLDNFYNRTIVQVQTEQGVVWAWTYVYAHDVDEDSIIEDGRWN